MKVMTKVAKGVAYGDVSNQSVRNILTEISKSMSGRFTEQEMFDTLDYFDWKCPYTGKDLRPLIEGNLGGYAADHVYPQNKEWCGLNVKGNLIMVDKDANAAKRSMDVEEFLLNDTKVLTDIDEVGRTRQERLELIRNFQNECGYDPQKIRNIVQPLLVARYEEIRVEQEKCIADALTALNYSNLKVTSASPISSVLTKTRTRKSLPELSFFPADEQQFKKELLKSKRARFVLTYESGVVKESPWKCEAFDIDSNLKANIQSRPFWRRKDQEGLVKVEVHIN
jgi:hypothetical protein